MTSQEMEEKAKAVAKTIEEKVDAFNSKLDNVNEKLNDGSKQSKAIIWGVAAIIAAIIIYFKQH